MPRFAVTTFDPSAPNLECFRLEMAAHDANNISLSQPSLLAYHFERGTVAPSKFDDLAYVGIAHYAPLIPANIFNCLASTIAALASRRRPSSERAFDCSSSKLARLEIISTCIFGCLHFIPPIDLLTLEPENRIIGLDPSCHVRLP